MPECSYAPAVRRRGKAHSLEDREGAASGGLDGNSPAKGQIEEDGLDGEDQRDSRQGAAHGQDADGWLGAHDLRAFDEGQAKSRPPS